jgi:hypothetical protein
MTQRWANQQLVLFHGTLDIHVASIRQAIDVTLGSPNTDFGQGFYTTTSQRQARSWAFRLFQRSQLTSSPGRTAVVSFTLERDALAGLEAIWFVRGSQDADDYWSLIFHCRSGRPDHGRKITKPGWYDVAIGPVAAQWRKRRAIPNADQISFHTCKGEGILNALQKSKKQAEVFDSGLWSNLP